MSESPCIHRQAARYCGYCKSDREARATIATLTAQRDEALDKLAAVRSEKDGLVLRLAFKSGDLAFAQARADQLERIVMLLAQYRGYDPMWFSMKDNAALRQLIESEPESEGREMEEE
jgi:hypothetical protein